MKTCPNTNMKNSCKAKRSEANKQANKQNQLRLFFTKNNKNKKVGLKENIN